MKHLLIVLSCACLLCACFDVPVDKIDEARKPPKVASIDPLSAEQVMQEHSSEFLQYEPIENSKIRFFDANGQLADKAVSGGFYRKVLGKTPHNRLVIQDFYQDNNKPYTLPFVAVPEPQLKIFRGAGVRDSRTAWLKPDGSLLRVSDFKQGKAVGETWFFEKNQAFAYIRLLDEKPKLSLHTEAASAILSASSTSQPEKNPQANTKPQSQRPSSKKDKTSHENTHISDKWDMSFSKGAALMRFFYPKGNLMAEVETDGEKQNKVILFYPNGAIMLQIEDDGEQSSHTAWDIKGEKVLPADVAIEADVLALRIEHGLNLMGRNQGELADLLLNH